MIVHRVLVLVLLGLIIETTYSFPHLSWFAEEGCSISVANDVPTPEPVLVLSNEPEQSDAEVELNLAPTPSFLVPPPGSSDDNIILSSGEAIIIACPGNNNYLPNVKGTPQQVEATCVSGSNVLIDGVEYSMNELACKSHPYSTAKLTYEECDENGVVFEIGFELEDNRFATIIQGCYNLELRTAIWTNFTLVGGIGGHKSGVSRPSWIQDPEFFGSVPGNNQYSRTVEQETIGNILGSKSLGTQYVKSSGDYFLSRGHTAAKADFVLASQQRATHHLVNALPQWQTFNGGNWNTLEQNLRDFVVKLGRDVKIWVGYHHVSTLPDVNDENKDLYLYTDENDNVAMPIPRHYWKLAYDPETQTGIVVIGYNNPYVEDDMKPLCEPGKDENPPSWITWKNSNDLRLGVMYWCTISSFLQLMPHLPQLPDNGILDLP